jgi:crotonobetainyl-CoA:carnitine CoA-transferase CaiB-like acyl-CoA transferase
MSDSGYALDGVRVLDLAPGIAGAYCTKLLVDAGASVVKVERPDGDPMRRKPAGGTELAPDRDSPLFAYLQRGKRSVVIDVAAPDGGASPMLTELAYASDVVVEDGTIRRLGTFHSVRASAPHLIVVSLSPFGLVGPWSDRVATDLTLQALSSSIAGRGDKSGVPLAAGGRLTDWAAGAAAAAAIAGALRQQRQTGQGDEIDVSELEVAVTIFNGFRAVSGQMAPPPLPPTRVVEVPSIEHAKDGWVGFCTLTHDQFSAFADMIEKPEWAADPDIRKINVRCDRAPELRPRIAEWTERHSVAEILHEAAVRRIPAAPVGNGATAPQVPHFAERGVFVAELDAQPRVPYRYSRTPQPPFGQTPGVGSTTADEVLSRWSSRDARRASDRKADGRPLEGVRVFDLSTYWAGPWASQILGFLGAEIIKVESVQRPDGTRLGTSYGMTGERVWERAPLFQAVNSAKKEITLDLTSEVGRRIARQVLEHCDVLIENYVPRVAERFGLLDNPREDLIVVRMPAWGLTGPWRDQPGFAQTMEQVSGLAWVTGDPNGPPLIPRGPCDPIGGFHAAFATLAALLERDVSGLGQTIEAPLVESALNVAAEQFVEYAASGTLIERTGNKSGTAAPHGVYACCDDESWVAIAIADDRQWDIFRKVTGEPAWAGDARFDTAAGRLAHEADLDARVAAWCADRTPEEITELLWPAGVPAAPVVLPHAIVGLPQLVARRFWEPVVHPLIGELRLPAYPARFASRDLPFHTAPAPMLGQHNEEVLGGLLGLSAAELEELAAEHVIGTEPI